jgi:D-alanyl-D-alanine carboxypeptidase
VRQLEQAIQDLELSRRVPGFQYVVVDATATLVESCAGSAELRSRPMALDTTMMAYSMSKTITAAAVLQLNEIGSIRLEDAVSRYVPWQPYGNDVTVRGLLSHTGGLPNPIPLRWVHPAEEHLLFNERVALRGVLGKHGKLVAHPGTRYAYSNIGYWLLGSLVEQVTGESFTSYVTQHLFTPLNLKPGEMAYVIVDPSRHATGHLERFSLLSLVKPLLIDSRLIDGSVGGWVAIRPHYADGPAFGGIVGTARAFGRFLQDQLCNQSKLFGRAAQASFIEPQRTSHGPVPMTLGWHIGSVNRHRYLFKEGGGGGFRSMMRLYKSRGIGTVLMANATTVSVSRILDRLDSQLL